MDFCLQVGTFDALRDAALALKALGRWDLVLERCILFRRRGVLDHPEIIKEEDVRATDDFPFRWLFPEKGFPPKLTQDQLRFVSTLREHLFLELRRTLRSIDGAQKDYEQCEKAFEDKFKKASVPPPAAAKDDYTMRVLAVSRVVWPRLRALESSFAHSKTHFLNNKYIWEKVDQAAKICNGLMDAFATVKAGLNLVAMQKQLDQLVKFAERLDRAGDHSECTDCSGCTYLPATTVPKKRALETGNNDVQEVPPTTTKVQKKTKK